MDPSGVGWMYVWCMCVDISYGKNKKYFVSGFSTTRSRIVPLIVELSDEIQSNAMHELAENASKLARNLSLGRGLCETITNAIDIPMLVSKFAIRNSTMFSFTSRSFNLISYRKSIFKCFLLMSILLSS